MSKEHTERIDPIAIARALIEPLTGYTPGPWDASGLTVYDTCMDGVASCHAGADARLIAAAPDLKDTLATAFDEIDRLRGMLEVMVLVFDEHVDLPDKNCSCHINPPCGDCVDYSFARDALSDARAALSGEGE